MQSYSETNTVRFGKRVLRLSVATATQIKSNLLGACLSKALSLALMCVSFAAPAWGADQYFEEFFRHSPMPGSAQEKEKGAQTVVVDPKQVLAFDQAKQLADAGNAYAQAVVALHYQLGWNTVKSPEVAFKYAMASANAGHPLGKFRLGALLRAGDGMPKDEQQGLSLQAASFDGLDRMIGDPYALTSLGVMIFQGKAAAQNTPQEQRYRQAAELYKRAADAGFAPAQFNYAMCAQLGHGVSKHDATSLSFLIEAAKQDYPLAFTVFRERGMVYGGEASYLPEHVLLPADDSKQANTAENHGLVTAELSGKTQWGAAWEFAFSDPAGLKNLPSACVPGETVYADNSWIVKHYAFSSAEPGFALFDLYFIDAKTLEVKGRFHSPDDLGRVLRVGKEGNNFAVLVQVGFKHSFLGQNKLLLINPASLAVEAVSCPSLPGSFADLALENDEVKVLAEGISTAPTDLKYNFKSQSFKGLSASLHEVVTYEAKAQAPPSVEINTDSYMRKLHLANKDNGDVEPFRIGNNHVWLRHGKWDWNKKRDDRLCALDLSLEDGGQHRLRLIQSVSGGDLRALNLLTLRNDHLKSPEVFKGIRSLRADGKGVIGVECIDQLWWIEGDGRLQTARPNGSGVFNSGTEFVVKQTPPGENWDQEWPGWRNEWMFIDGRDWQSGGRANLSVKVAKYGPNSAIHYDEVHAPEPEQLFPRDMYMKDAAGSRLWMYYNETGDTLLSERMDLKNASSIFYALKIVGADGKRWPTIVSATAKPDAPHVILGEEADDWWVVAAQTHTTTSTMPHSIYLLGHTSETVHTLAEGLSGGVKLLEIYGNDQDEIQVIYAVGDLIKVVAINIEDVRSTIGKHVEKLSALDESTGAFGIKEDVLALKELGSWGSANTGLPPLYAKSHRLLFVPMPSGYQLFQLKASETPQKVAELYLGNGEEFAILLPDGVYAGSPGCETALLETIEPNSALEAALLAPWRNRPAEVLKVLGGDSTQVSALEKVTHRWLKRLGHPEQSPEPQADDVPSIELAEEVPLWAQGDRLAMRFRARSGGRAPRGGVLGAVGSLLGGGKPSIERVSVRVNGVEQAGALAVEGGDGEWLQEVKLAEGQNWIEASATDANGHSSNLLRFRVLLAESKQSARRYIIALGVSEYQEPALNLAYAAKDAQDVANTMRGAGGDSQMLVLLNSDVTKGSLAKIEEFLKPARENDEVVVFCAGHGVLDGNLDYVFASHDFDPDRPAETGIKLDDLIDTIGKSNSLKRLLLLDTCHAGQVGEREEILLAQLGSTLPKGVRAVQQRGMSLKPVEGMSAESQQRFIEEMFSLPGLHRGINVIGASGGAEFALESEKWSNGVFTAALIEALRDKKADANGDGRVGVAELRSYLADRVPKLTGGAQKPSVVAFERDQDFDLVN